MSLEPAGPTRDNIHAAIIASTIVNVNRSKDSPEANPSDFMVKDAEQKQMEHNRRVVASFQARAQKSTE